MQFHFEIKISNILSSFFQPRWFGEKILDFHFVKISISNIKWKFNIYEFQNFKLSKIKVCMAHGFMSINWLIKNHGHFLDGWKWNAPNRWLC